MNDIPREKIEKAIEEIDDIDTEVLIQSDDGILTYGIRGRSAESFKSECMKILNKLLEDE